MNQLSSKSTADLLRLYQNKVHCDKCNAIYVYNVLYERLGEAALRGVRDAIYHAKQTKDWSVFDAEMDRLVKNYSDDK